MAKEILYNPNNIGNVVLSKRGKQMRIRKYHLTSEEKNQLILRHKEDTKDVPEVIKGLAGEHFFNPYRKGIYWAQIQALYLLGSNRWHNFKIVLDKTKELMISFKYIDKQTGIETNLWEKFKNKTPKDQTVRSKDIIGRIQENFIFCQRLGCNHPSGYKLRQAHSSLDIKKVTKKGFSQGLYFYRLSTYSTEDESYPVRDYSEYELSEKEYRHIREGFLGTILTPKGEFGIHRNVTIV